MNVGVLKEIKNNENRVGMTPTGVQKLTKKGHKIFVEKNAGIGSGFLDLEYKKAGATIKNTAKEVCKNSELIIKVKEPLPQEYSYFNQNHKIFTYFHFASSKRLTQGMMKTEAACIAYETIEGEKDRLPLLKPMSEVAGKMSVQMAAYYLAKFNMGKGILISGVTGVNPAKATIIGGGIVGQSATIVASAMGADTTILEINNKRIKQLKKILPKNVKVIKSTQKTLEKLLKETDILVGAVLVPGAKAPKIVTRKMVKTMQPGSVIVDVAIDQGGCVETSKPTTHSKPVYTIDNVIHYCVANMPGAYPRTSTLALTTATLPYILKLADQGLDALKKDKLFRLGLNAFKGKCTNEGVAKALKLKFVDPLTVL